MTHLLGRSMVTPVHAAPGRAGELVTQLLLGEGAEVHVRQGRFFRIRTSLDGVEGWVGQADVLPVDRNRHDGWLATAYWSGEGSFLYATDQRIVVPLRARIQREGPARIRLPDGSSARVTGGTFGSMAETITAAQAVAPAAWAWQAFGGAPYLPGGLTRGGVDGAGLVQTTFLARGVPLPRNAAQQAEFGLAGDPDAVAPGDLLFFGRAAGGGIEHVGIADNDGLLVHADSDEGRVVREPWRVGGRADRLRPLLVAVRRLT